MKQFLIIMKPSIIKIKMKSDRTATCILSIYVKITKLGKLNLWKKFLVIFQMVYYVKTCWKIYSFLIQDTFSRIFFWEFFSQLMFLKLFFFFHPMSFNFNSVNFANTDSTWNDASFMYRNRVFKFLFFKGIDCCAFEAQK